MKTKRSMEPGVKTYCNNDHETQPRRHTLRSSTLSDFKAKTGNDINSTKDFDGNTCNSWIPSNKSAHCKPKYKAEHRQDNGSAKLSKSCDLISSSGSEFDGRKESRNTNSTSKPNLCMASKVASNAAYFPETFSKTLKIRCERVDVVLNNSQKRRKQHLLVGQDIDDNKLDNSPGNNINEQSRQVDAHKELKETTPMKEAKFVPKDYTTPTNRRTADLCADSPKEMLYATSEADNTELDRSFRLDVLNMGYSVSPKPTTTQPNTPKPAKAEKKKLKLYLNVSPTVGNFRITAPLYQCTAYQPSKSVFNADKLKKRNGGQKRKPVKRKLCSEIRSSTTKCSNTLNDKMNLLLRTATPNSATQSTSKPYTLYTTKSEPRAKLSTQGKEQIWLSPSLQIDTMGCNATGGIKKDYNRVVVVCLFGSSFTPTKAVSSYPDAINARITYDKAGRVAVIEPMSKLFSGIYRVIFTKDAHPHTCLRKTVAMETLLTKCSSIEDLKPHSQYVLITDMYRVPKTQWREKLSATVVRLHLEDYLYTANFHKYALPLLKWNEEVDTWSWTKEKSFKFHAKRKRTASSSTEKSRNTEKKVKLTTQIST